MKETMTKQKFIKIFIPTNTIYLRYVRQWALTFLGNENLVDFYRELGNRKGLPKDSIRAVKILSDIEQRKFVDLGFLKVVSPSGLEVLVKTEGFRSELDAEVRVKNFFGKASALNLFIPNWLSSAFVIGKETVVETTVEVVEEVQTVGGVLKPTNVVRSLTTGIGRQVFVGVMVLLVGAALLGKKS